MKTSPANIWVPNKIFHWAPKSAGLKREAPWQGRRAGFDYVAEKDGIMLLRRPKRFRTILSG